MSHTPDAALDLLLALRPEDLDADELDELTALATGANDRAALEAGDSRLAELIDAWADEDLFADELFRLEGITGASILARAESEDELAAISDQQVALTGLMRRLLARLRQENGPGSYPRWRDRFIVFW